MLPVAATASLRVGPGRPECYTAHVRHINTNPSTSEFAAGIPGTYIDRMDQTGPGIKPSVNVTIDHDLCESTGTCATICPENVFAHENKSTRVVNTAACTNCWICVENCVSGAIELD